MDVSYVAKLANIPLTSEEKDPLSTQLNHILTYVEQLQSVDTSNVSPTSQAINTLNSTRQDTVSDCLKLATDYFKVPAIFTNE